MEVKAEKLKVSALQCDLHWEDVDKNLWSISNLLQEVPRDTEVIVLPEMFTTGFSMNLALAATMNGVELATMKKWAKQHGAAVIGSLMMKDKGSFFNRLLWVNPTGEVFAYDKKHLFTYGKENKSFKPGNDRLVVQYKGWNFACFICYDLRFPVWTRNVNNEYDVAIYVANWPQKRSRAWSALLVARAIENQSYVVGVNRTGQDGNGLVYDGSSAVVNFEGDPLAVSDKHHNHLSIAVLDKKKLASSRTDFPVSNDADDFKLIE